MNGRGRVNGLVNGRGFINGSAVTEPRFPRKSRRPQYVAIGAAVVAALVIAAALVPPTEPTPAIVIDGSFEDWEGVPAYADGTASANPDVYLRSVSLATADSSLFLRMEVAGVAFGDASDYDTAYAFLDTDGDAGTGYDLSGLGADFLARVSGSNGTVEDARLMRFESGDRVDWNGWRSVGGVAAASSGSQVEVEVRTDALEPLNATVLLARFAFDDNRGETSHTVVPIGLALGALQVTQRGLASTLGTGTQPFLEIRFEALGAGSRVVVSGVALETSAGVFSPVPQDFVVTSEQPVVHVVNVDPAGLPAGSVAFARVRAVQADRPLAIAGTEARAYVGAPPPETRIDGLFADWPSPIPDTDPAPVRRPALNIVGRDGTVVGSDVFLYVRLGGTALEGSLVPDRLVRPPPGGEGAGEEPVPAPPPPPRIGEDYVRVYLDTNASDPLGFPLDGFAVDRLVEVRGRGGVATNASVYRWSGTDWAWDVAATPGVGAEELEVGAAMPAVEFNVTRLVAIAADWSGDADVTDAEATRTRTRGDPGLSPLHGTNALTALAKPLTNIPTVDGSCGTTSNEYQGADERSNSDLKFFVGRRSTISRVYVCVEVTADTSDDLTADWGQILFDRNHDGGTAPQTDDRRFRVTSGSATISSFRGTGSAWTACGGACYLPSAAGAFNNSRQVYEFNISFWDVWGTNTTSANQVAGFAIQAYNDATALIYKWGSDNVAQNVPDTWGHLEIPEFADVAPVAIAVLLLVPWFRRRRGGFCRRNPSHGRDTLIRDAVPPREAVAATAHPGAVGSPAPSRRRLSHSILRNQESKTMRSRDLKAGVGCPARFAR